MMIPVVYLVYYLGMILAQMPSMLQVNLANSTASSVHSDLDGLYQKVGQSAYQKIEENSGRYLYIFRREGGRSWWQYIEQKCFETIQKNHNMLHKVVARQTD